MKVYIAAPFFNEDQIRIVEELELTLEQHEIDYFSPRSEGTLSNMTREEQELSHRSIFESNVRNMDDCTHMIACVQYKDTGTIWEMGYMFGQEKEIVMMSEADTVNVMLAQSATGIAKSAEHAVNIILGLEIGAEIGNYT